MRPLKHIAHLNALPYAEWIRQKHNETNLIYLPDSVNETNETILVGEVLNEIDTDDDWIKENVKPGTQIFFEMHTSIPISGQKPLETGEYVTRIGGPWGTRGVLAILEN